MTAQLTTLKTLAKLCCLNANYLIVQNDCLDCKQTNFHFMFQQMLDLRLNAEPPDAKEKRGRRKKP